MYGGKVKKKLYLRSSVYVTSKCAVTNDVLCRTHAECNDSNWGGGGTLTYHKVRTFISNVTHVSDKRSTQAQPLHHALHSPSMLIGQRAS
jgi:hypothetical protein